MERLVASIATILSLSMPAAALAQPKSPGKPTSQAAVNQTYLTMLNRALAQNAPAYLNLSNQDKLSYGHYTCQALDAKVTLQTVAINYIQVVTKSVPPELQHQAGIFLVSSTYAGVYNFCPKYLPQLGLTKF